MGIDAAVQEVMMKALEGNLAYRQEERVVLVTQRWDPSLGEETQATIGRAAELCEALRHTYAEKGIDVELFTYVPDAARSGVNPSRELIDSFSDYEARHGVPDIVIAPAAYSVTHTNWRRAQNERGSRIATMSNASLAMFAPGGPFDVQGDYQETVVKRTLEAAENLRKSEYVHVVGKGTCLAIQVDRDLVHEGTGHICEPRSIDNWLGAEAYAVPVHKGNSYGYFTTPAGWGGRERLKHATTFHIQRGSFIDAIAADGSAQAQEWIDQHLKPQLFGKPGYEVVAELGIGTNPAVSEDYLMANWSIAVAEKKGGTVHIAHGNSQGMGGQNAVDIHQDFVIADIERVDFIR